jgi:hypothetical protein
MSRRPQSQDIRLDDLAARATAMLNAAGVADMSDSELRAYVLAQEERLLESGEPLLVKLVLAGRRARARAEAGDRTPFGRLLAEETGDL